MELSAITGLPYISIHAPPRGATENKNAFLAGIDISIHAPPRGATWSFPPSRDYPTFQFTPLREGRLKTQEFHAMAAISIHAPPRGATAWSCLVCHHCYFNSHPSARGDTKRSLRVCVLLIFQFTPLREGRRSRGHFLLCDDYFNSRPSARGDSDDPAGQRISTNFNSRPSARGDREAHPMAEAIGKFQFTPLREGRPCRVR